MEKEYTSEEWEKEQEKNADDHNKYWEEGRRDMVAIRSGMTSIKELDFYRVFGVNVRKVSVDENGKLVVVRQDWATDTYEVNSELDAFEFEYNLNTDQQKTVNDWREKNESGN